MPRALLLFQQQGINVEPFPVDFRATGHRIDWTYFFPSASGFYKTSKGIREYIGRIYYLFKLWNELSLSKWISFIGFPKEISVIFYFWDFVSLLLCDKHSKNL